jgi:predicted permease
VVVSHVFWTSRLNGDPAIVGRTIWIGRTAATIVGVAERGFSLPHNRLLWMPLSAYGAVHTAMPVTPGDIPVEVFGRLSPDVTIAQAEAQLSGVAASLPQSPIAGDSAVRVRLDAGAGLGRMSSADALGITMSVFAVIALVLLLACANVATVLISTAITREREMGVRAALGASRPRIVRQLLTESLALGAVAATLGLLIASWSIPAIGTMIEAPADADLAPDLIVYLFLGVAALVVGAGAGLAPAWHGRGVDLVTPLKGSEAASQRRLAPRRLRSALVMTQAAAAVLLIVLATLFVRASFRTSAIDVGFDAAGLYALSTGFEAGGPGSAQARRFWEQAMIEVRALPGITAAALVEMTPFDGTTRSSVTGAGPAAVVTYFNRTDAEFFETIGVRILAGRAFSSDEAAMRAPVAVVSESLARAYWRDGSPLGQSLPSDIAIPAISPSSTRPVIVGVVADAITARLHERNAFAVYEPIDPATDASAQLLVRAARDATGAIERASGRLRAIDPQVDVRIASVAARLQQEAGRPRMLATLTGIIGAIAVVLCVIGLYGLTASVVGQRTREMGVRAAMGAGAADLLRLLLWDSLRPVVFGLALGAGTALAASRVLEAAMFFGVSPRDPLAFAVSAAVLLGAASLAVLVPTRRAAAVDAAVLLRRA